MITFDFISDEILRNSLEKDYQELSECIKTKSWKAVHVLAGSIIETLLLDYLIEADYAKRKSTDLKKLKFIDIINICKSEGILTNKSADLSHVIREYRNLIHPEKLIRVSETVDEDSATIAQALVRMITGEVATKRKQTHGYTAEQIIKKIETDSSASSILIDLLNNTQEGEKKRLLLKIIPQKYFSLSDQDDWRVNPSPSDSPLITTLTKCFHYTFEAASAETKKAAAEEFLRVIKEESIEMVRIYELRLFKGADLIYCPPHEIQIITKHILSTLREIPVYKQTLENTQGISKFLKPKEIEDLVDIIMKEFISQDYEETSTKLYLDTEYHNMSDEGKNATMSRLEIWKNFYEDKNKSNQANEVQIIIDYLKEELLF